MISAFDESFVEELMMDGSVEQIMTELYKSTALICRVLFPLRFKREFGPRHQELFEALDDPNLRRFLLMAHRDFGKTSILQLGFASKNLLFNDCRFIVPVSCSAMQAIMQSDNLKSELTSNSVIRELWGDMQPVQKEMPFSKQAWTLQVKDAEAPTVVVPRGAGQQLRGLLFGNARPDLLLVDDLEDPQDLLSEEARAKQKSWFAATMENIVDIAEEDYRIIMMGTPVHQDCLLWDLIKDTENWTSISISLCDENFKTLWPQRFKQETVDRLVARHRKHFTMDEFYREFMNLPTAGEDAAFQQRMFRYYDPTKINLDDPHVAENIMIVDPAKTVKLHSAESGIVVIGLGIKANKFYVRDAVGTKLHPDELYNRAFDMAITYNVRIIGVEVTSLEDFIKHPFIEASIRRGLNFNWVWLKARGKKEERIRELVSYYRSGIIVHNKYACHTLEQQLMSFPFSQRWDVMDALGYLNKMLEQGERYFQYFNLYDDEENMSNEEFDKKLEKEYAGLDDDYPLELNNWAVFKD